MQQSLPFDPTIYYGLVADRLLQNFGSRAFFVADQALKKMKALGDDEGFDIWLSIHEQLSVRTTEPIRSEDAVLH